MSMEFLVNTDRILEVKNLVGQLKQQTEELRGRVDKLNGSLEWKVASREAIGDNLKSICASLEKQMNFMENAGQLCTTAVSLTDETSNGMIQSISQILFLFTGIMTPLLMFQNLIHTPNGVVTTTITNNGTNSTNSVPIAQTNSGATTTYQNSSVNYKGDYSNYNVVSCYNENQVLWQKDERWRKQFYSNGNAGCVVTAEAMVYNMKHPDAPISPTQCGENGGPNCTYSYTNKTPGYENASLDTKRDMIFDSINNGEPCMVRTYGAYKGSGHTVVAVGIREGAQRGSLTNADILIIDPADGKVKTLAQMGGDIKEKTNLYTAK